MPRLAIVYALQPVAMDADTVASLQAFLEGQDDVVLAYLFGSQASGDTGSLSDVDVAVSFSDDLDRDTRFRRRLALTGEISAIVGTATVDVVVLDDASVSLCFEVIKANHPLVVRDSELKVDFEHRVLSRYLDRRRYERRTATSFLTRVANNGLGGA